METAILIMLVILIFAMGYFIGYLMGHNAACNLALRLIKEKRQNEIHKRTNARKDRRD